MQRRSSIFGGEGRDFYLNQIKKWSQLKGKVHETCVTSKLYDVSLARELMKLNSFICLIYHLPDKLKFRHKVFRYDPLIESFVPTFFLPYGSLNKSWAVFS